MYVRITCVIYVVQIWMAQLLRYGGVASPVAVRARTQLLKEADPGSNRVGSRRGAVWSARAARARSAFWAADFGDVEAAVLTGPGSMIRLRVIAFSITCP